MPRTPAMSLLRSAAKAAAAERWAERAPPRPGRRAALKGALGLGAAASLGLRPAFGQSATARIAVVGAGLAGLTAAHRLKQAGFAPSVIEGDTRLGGRCLTARGAFAGGQVVERGGEFIDTDHRAIRELAAELGLQLYDVLAAQAPGAIPVYRFDAQRYTLADATAEFGPVYDALQAQQAAIGDRVDYRTASPAAKRFDAMTARDWIRAHVPGGLSSKLGRLIDNAFSEEDAADTDRQSALNVVLTLAGDRRDDFDLYYTGSDQRFRVSGGNDGLVTALAAALGGAIETGARLTAVERLGAGRVRLTTARGGAVRDDTYDRVVLALPFSVMRAGVDTSRAGFSALKERAIRTIGIGASVKFQLQFERRLWEGLGCNGEIRLASEAFQTSWDATRGQAGASGVLNFWSGGSQAAFDAAAPDPRALARACLAGAEQVLPGLSPLWNGRHTLDVWKPNPWSLGSYTSYAPGYLTTLSGVEGLPEGDVFFAGEHTSGSTGYLNSAVASGNRAAGELAASLAS